MAEKSGQKEITPDVIEEVARVLCKRTDCQARAVMEGEPIKECQTPDSCCARFHKDDARAAASVLLGRAMNPSVKMLSPTGGVETAAGQEVLISAEDVRASGLWQAMLRAFASEHGIEIPETDNDR